MAASRQQAGALRTTKTAARHKQVRERSPKVDRGTLRPSAEYLPTTQPLQLFGWIIDLPLPPPRRCDGIVATAPRKRPVARVAQTDVIRYVLRGSASGSRYRANLVLYRLSCSFHAVNVDWTVVLDGIDLSI